jgi:hypothetical protein
MERFTRYPSDRDLRRRSVANSLQPAARRSSSAAPWLLSAIEINLAKPEFVGALLAYGDDDAFRTLKERQDVFAYRQRGRAPEEEVLVLPLVDAPRIKDCSFGSLPARAHLPAIAHLIEKRLVDLLPKLELRRGRWGLERIRRTDDLLDQAFKQIRERRPDELAGFHQFHRTLFRVRVEYIAGRAPALMLTVEFRRHQEVTPTLAQLVERGFELAGLDVFEKGAERRRNWLGMITRVEGTSVVLHDGARELGVDGRSHFIEPSSQAFSALFQQVLGPALNDRLRQAESRLRAREVCGRGYVSRLSQVAEHLQKAGSLAIAPALNLSFGPVVGLSAIGSTPPVKHLPNVEYCFSWDRTAIDTIPAAGLDKYGPFDGTTFDMKEPRLLVVCPADSRNDVDHFVRRLRDGMAREGKTRFARGLVGTYRLNRMPTSFVTVPLASESQIGPEYVHALRDHLGSERAPDIALVVIRDQDAFIENDNPYRATKAFLLAQGIPSQEVRLSRVRETPGRLPFILENIAAAMYAKLGGVPWTIRPSLPLTKEVVIGMAHAQFGGRYSPLRRFMGITTVFSSDGTYLLAAGSPRCEYEAYPETLAASVRDTLRRLAVEQNWSSGDVVRLVFHAPKPLTGSEIDTIDDIAVRALGKQIQFESAFLTIETDHPFKVVEPNARGREMFVEERFDGTKGRAMVGECAPKRGTVVDFGRFKRLLCVNGPLLMKREGESIPQPLQITLHRKSTYTDLGALTRQVFHFTGLSWRSMLPVTAPVTILYSRLIAEQLMNLSDVPGWSDELLDTRLRRSRWFL